MKKMTQREVYKILKKHRRWLTSKEINDLLEKRIQFGNLSKNIKRLMQSGLVKSKFIERNTYKYMVINKIRQQN